MGYSRLEPGRELEVREYISFQRGRDGFCELIECSVDELLERKAESIVREKELCQRIDAAVEVWSKQAQQTQQYMKALEYVKTPPTPHTSNRWTVNEYGNHEMSNMVYRFSWREYEHTEWDRTLEKSVPKSWELTWSVTFNTPHNPDYSGDGWKIAGQDRKIFRDRASMEKYLQGRIAAYADLFVEICPPIPTEHKDRFSINGQLMQGYMVATKEPERPDQGQVDALLDCLDEADMLEVPTLAPKKQHSPKGKPRDQKEIFPDTVGQRRSASLSQPAWNFDIKIPLVRGVPLKPRAVRRNVSQIETHYFLQGE